MPKIQESSYNNFNEYNEYENACSNTDQIPMQYIFNKKPDLKKLLQGLYIGEKNTSRNWKEIINDLFLGFEINFTDQENNNYFVRIITS